MKKIFLLFMLCCLTLGAFAQAPTGGLTSKDTTLVDPVSGQSKSWTAPLGTYQITKIEIIGDGGNGGKANTKGSRGGNGGNGAHITDVNTYELPSFHDFTYYYDNAKGTGKRSVSFYDGDERSLIEYFAGNGANGTDARNGGGSSGTPGFDGANGNSYPTTTSRDVTVGHSTNGGAGGTASGQAGAPGGKGYVKLTYQILTIPVTIIKEGYANRETTILYYDEIGHTLNAADSQKVESFYYDPNFVNQVNGTDLCQALPDSAVILYAKISPLAVTVDSVNSTPELDCKGAETGKITVTATGSLAPYTYSKDGVNYANGNVFENLAAGSYTLYAATANDTASVIFEITEPDSVKVTLSSSTPVTMLHGSDGAFVVSTTGGTGAYTYSLDKAAYAANSENTFSNLAAGRHTLTARDANNCESDTLVVNISDSYPIYSIKAGTTDTVGHLTFKAAVDTLNKYNGGTVLVCADETLTQTVTISKSIKVLAHGGDVTLTRGSTMTSPLIEVYSQLTIGESKDDPYQIIFDGDEIANNTSSAFVNYGFLSLNGKVVMKNHTSSNDGSAIYNNSGNLQLNGELSFTNNKAVNGGAIYDDSGVHIGENANIIFENNIATGNGGAIYTETELAIGMSAIFKFEGNRAGVNGGAIYSNYTYINMESSGDFINNYAAENGGAIYITGNDLDIYGAQINFEGNRAGANGGAILSGSELTINSAQINFEGNRAGANGGAIYNNEHNIYINYAQVKFEDDSAAYGGAIYIHQGGLKINFATVLFKGDSAQYGGAIYNEDASSINIGGEDLPVIFENNGASENGGAIFNANYCSLDIDEFVELVCKHNQAKKGAAIYNEGRVESKGTMNLIENIATQGGIVYNVNNWFYFAKGEIHDNVVKSGADNRSDNGVVVLKDGFIQIAGGTIANNIFVNETGHTLDTLPASLVYDASRTGEQQFILEKAAFVDTIRLLLDGDYEKNITISEDLTVASEEQPIVLLVDTLDKQIISAGFENNYKKFKPAADTLDVNNKGWLVRIPQITVDTIYLLQAGTNYADYGITTTTGEVDVDKIYVEYTQTVDAHGIDNITTSDSTIIEMNVIYNGTTSHVRQTIAAQENGQYAFTLPLNSDLWDVKPTTGILVGGTYTVDIDTLIVHTLGISAGTEKTLEKDVFIPTLQIDTLNFLLAGMKFSDFEYNGTCDLSNTNDGAGDDIIPMDEIYVGYQRSTGGNVDTAFIKVTLTDANSNVYVYEEGTVAGQILTPGCGHFRQFTNSAKWTPALNLNDAFDGQDISYDINIYQRTEGDPYFAVGVKSGTYHHEIDRECSIALENATECAALGIHFEINGDNDTITLTYPNYFDKNAVPAAMKQDGVIKVGISFDPQDEKLTKAWFDEATDITATDDKYIVWIPISKAISASNPIVVAENYAITPDTLRLSHTDVKGVYRKTFVVEGTYTPAEVTTANVTYHTTGASGVKFASDGGPLFKLYFDANDYTVWNVQNPQSFGKDNNNVYAGLYVNRPNNSINAVYSSYNGFDADTVKTLANDLIHQLADTAYIQYVKLGTCADQATKDYTFITKPNTAPADFTSVNGRLDTVYWFIDSLFVKAERYSVRYYYAPKYTVDFRFNGGGALCNTPYSNTFADTTYTFGRPIDRPEDPFKCGNLFMDWRHGVDSFTVDSFKNIRAGISEATGATVAPEPFGIRSNMVIDAAWKYFVTLSNPHDTAVVADYSLCEIRTRDYVWEPTESQLPYVYTFHTDYLGKYYREYSENTTNCDVRFEANAFTENPTVLPVGTTSHVTWTVTDMCGTPFTIGQDINVKFPPCGADNYNPHLYPFTPYDTTYKAIDFENNLYETVRVGCDCWTKENLKSLYYTDGTEIPVAQAYLNKEENVDEFGRLYTWYSAVNLPENSNEVVVPLNADNMPQGVCPDGWYLPAEEDFSRMSNLDNIQGASVGVKTDGSNAYWLGHLYGDNSTGFSAKPAGFYNTQTERYYNLLGDAYFWSSSSTTTASAPCCVLTHSCPNILILNNNKWYGYSIRCIKYRKFDY